MNSIRRFGFAVFFLLVSAVTGGCATGESSVSVAKSPDLKEILVGKVAIGKGYCYFKDGAFFLFATGTSLSPKGIVKREICAVFTETANLNPVWLLLGDETGNPMEVLRWKDGDGEKPHEIKSIWKAVPAEQKEKPLAKPKKDGPEETQPKPRGTMV